MGVYLSERPRVSSSTTQSPCYKCFRWIQNNMLALVFSVGGCIVFLLLTFMACSIWVFLGIHLAQSYTEGEVSAMDIWVTPQVGAIKIIGCILVVLYVIGNMQQRTS